MTDFLEQYAQVDDARSDEVVRGLEADEIPEGLDPVVMVAAVAWVGLGGAESAGLPLIRATPLRPRLAAILARDATLARWFPAASRPDRLALAAGLLQVLDAWEASHHAAQEADDLGESTTAAAWHMIAHRREPDPGNARYWARRVAPDRAFAPLGRLAAPLLAAPGSDPQWASRLVDRTSTWNPSALIDLASSQVRPDSAPALLVRRLQRLEMLVLLGQSTALGR